MNLRTPSWWMIETLRDKSNILLNNYREGISSIKGHIAKTQTSTLTAWIFFLQQLSCALISYTFSNGKKQQCRKNIQCVHKRSLHTKSSNVMNVLIIIIKLLATYQIRLRICTRLQIGEKIIRTFVQSASIHTCWMWRVSRRVRVTSTSYELVRIRYNWWELGTKTANFVLILFLF